MINNIKKSTFPNNIFLEINGLGWKHSDEIMRLSPDHIVGAKVVMEVILSKYNNDFLRERYVNMKTFKEIAEGSEYSDTKVSQMISSYIEEIKEDKNLSNYILKGYDYTKSHL